MKVTEPAKPFRSRYAIVATLMALTVLSGVVHGVLDGRWTTKSSRADEADLLANLPTEFGPWRLVEENEVEDNVQRLLRCYGSVLRTYEHQPTGMAVNVAVFFGPRGPIAVHKPEVCYRSTGTTPMGERVAETFVTDKMRHQLWALEFRPRGEVNPTLEVFYGWSDGAEFVAAEEPRYWMTDDLYKIQLAGPITGAEPSLCYSFLEAFLPHLETLVQ